MSSSEEIAKAAKLAFEESQLFPSAERVNALQLIRKELDLRKADILAANAEDLKVCLTPTSSRRTLIDTYPGCAGGGRCRPYVSIYDEPTRSWAR